MLIKQQKNASEQEKSEKITHYSGLNHFSNFNKNYLYLMYTMKTVHCLIFTCITSLKVGSRLCNSLYYVDLCENLKNYI